MIKERGKRKEERGERGEWVSGSVGEWVRLPRREGGWVSRKIKWAKTKS